MTSDTTADAETPSKAWWNAALFVGLTGVSLFAYVFISSVLANSRATAGSVALAIPPVLLAVTLLWANRLFVRREGWTLSAIGLDRTGRRARDFVVGLLAGLGLIVIWAGIVAACSRSPWRVAASFDARGAAMVLCLTFFVNASEELAYRGYLFVRIARSTSPMVAILTTSTVFFLYHVQSGIPWDSALAGVFTSGVLYAVIFARWRSVPATLAFHWGNNLAQHLLGFRIGPLTLVEPSATPSDRAAAAILLGVAGINLLVVASVCLWPRNPEPMR